MWRSLNPAATRLHKNLNRLSSGFNGFRNYNLYRESDKVEHQRPHPNYPHYLHTP